MAKNDKKVTIEVGTEVDLSDVEALEDKIKSIEKEKLDLNVNANKRNIDEIDNEIATLKREIKGLSSREIDVRANATNINELINKIHSLEQKKVDLNIAIEKTELDEVKSEIDVMDESEIDINVNNISAMTSLSQIGDGIDRLKQGASEVAEQFGGILESAGRMEQTEAFLSMNIGTDKAKQKLKEIREVTDALPGDDVTLQNLLSQSAMKDASMTKDAFSQMGSAAADYMSAMENFGKTSTETQQDLMNYILAGNTAEIERSPILQAHIDKLKEGNTVQERSKLLQEALTAEGWNGIASQDIYNNKLQKFNDMLERGKMNLGDIFLKGSEGAIDFITQLDDATNGLVGMGVALASFGSPITDTIMGIGQIATGFKSLKEASDLFEITEKLSTLKTTVLDGFKTRFTELGTIISNTATKLYNFAGTTVNTLKTSLISLGGKIKEVGTALLTMGRNALISGANAVRSAVMWGIQKTALIASTIYTYALSTAQAILNVVMSLNPVMILVIALMALAGALIWAYYNVEEFRKFVDGLWQSIQDLINGFIGWVQDGINQFATAVQGIPQAIQDCLDWAYQLLMNHPIVQGAIWLGEQIANGFSAIGLGQHSPGKIVQSMTQELEWTEKAIEDSRLAQSSSKLGNQVSKGFNPNLNSISGGNTGNNITINIENVDNEERVQQIVKAVEKALKFDNLTAGRTV